jgi:hypothetical protein
MAQGYNRKTSPKVIGGLVQRKNNHFKTARNGYVVDRKRAGKGYRHVIKKKDIHDFTDIIPDWEVICEGIESIILGAGDEFLDGLYRHYNYEDTGIIWLSAWHENLWVEFNDAYFKQHQWHFDMLGVVYEKKVEEWSCHFTETQAKGFMLLHIFLHELGHHVDKLRSRKKNIIRGGEEFAENYANQTLVEIWPDYCAKFGQP